MIFTISRSLDELEVPYAHDNPASGFDMQVPGAHCTYDCVIRVDLAAQIVACYLGIAFRVPGEKRQAVCETLTRANYGLRVGNFELDLEDGEVRYNVSLDIEGGELTTTMAQMMIASGRATFDSTTRL